MFEFIGSFWPLLLLALLLVMAFVLRRKNTYFYWTSRIVAILYIVYLAWESLDTAGYKIDNLFMDNILTSIPLLLILLIGWMYDIVGAIGFCLAGAFYLAYFDWGDFPIGVPAVFIGILFAVNWFRKRKEKKL